MWLGVLRNGMKRGSPSWRACLDALRRAFGGLSPSTAWSVLSKPAPALPAISYTNFGVILGQKVNKESDVMVIDSAKGDTFDAYYKPGESSTGSKTQAGEGQSMLKPLFDGSASWFT